MELTAYVESLNPNICSAFVIIAPLENIVKYLNENAGNVMKKLFLIISIILLCSGCDHNSEAEISFTEESDVISQPEESLISPEEIFDFLDTDYYITAEQETSGNIYKYVYYLVDGKVAGTRTTAVFENDRLASGYAETLREDEVPYVRLDGNTVVAYYGDEYEAYYQGYSLEKMKFVLERIGYKYEICFDEDEFYTEFSQVSEAEQTFFVPDNFKNTRKNEKIAKNSVKNEKCFKKGIDIMISCVIITKYEKMTI